MSFIAAALIGGGMSMAGSIASSSIAAKAAKRGSQTSGYDSYTPPQYSWTEPGRQLASDYAQRGLASMQQGNPPTWWSNAMPKLQAGMSRQNALTYFGNPGTRQGTVNNAMAIGSMAGLKGKRAATPGMQANQEYANRESSINDYLNSLGVNVMQQSESQYMNSLNQAPGGPGGQALPYGSTTQPTDWASSLAPLMSSLGQADWSQMYNKNTGLSPWSTTFGGYDQYGVNKATNSVASNYI